VYKGQRGRIVRDREIEVSRGKNKPPASGRGASRRRQNRWRHGFLIASGATSQTSATAQAAVPPPPTRQIAHGAGDARVAGSGDVFLLLQRLDEVAHV
jgi:hypothetical protein